MKKAGQFKKILYTNTLRPLAVRTVRGENQEIVARLELAHFEFGVGNHKRFQCAIAKGARHGQHTLYAPAESEKIWVDGEEIMWNQIKHANSKENPRHGYAWIQPQAKHQNASKEHKGSNAPCAVERDLAAERLDALLLVQAVARLVVAAHRHRLPVGREHAPRVTGVGRVADAVVQIDADGGRAVVELVPVGELEKVAVGLRKRESRMRSRERENAHSE